MASQLLAPSRRGFLAGFGALLIAAPAIVRSTSIMPVRAISPTSFTPIAADVLKHCGITLDEYAEWVLAPTVNKLAENVAFNIMRGNNLLTVPMITREALRMFQNSNAFVQRVDQQFAAQFPAQPVRVRLPPSVSIVA